MKEKHRVAQWLVKIYGYLIFILHLTNHTENIRCFFFSKENIFY